MRVMSVKQARQQFAKLIKTALNGGSVTITRRGRPVAQIAPVTQSTPGPLPDLAEFRASLTVKGEPLSAVVTELRKQARY